MKIRTHHSPLTSLFARQRDNAGMSGAERMLLSVGAMTAALTLAIVAEIGTAVMLGFLA